METVNITIDHTTICNAVLHEQLDKLGLKYTLNRLNEIRFHHKLTREQKDQLGQTLQRYGVTILEDRQNVLVQRIKDLIVELINDIEKGKKYNVSSYLSEQLNYSYTHLSAQFSEVTHSSIENFIILKKIDAAKQMIIEKNLTLTEIAFRLNYSSVAHLSAQFKKTTGLTPSAFQRIIKKRQELKP